jgi:micrococcal nuclease
MVATRLMPGVAAYFALVAMGTSGALAQAPAPRAEQFQARVSEVVDGDTVHLQPIGGREEIKARLLGIDAPEICQAFGNLSRDALARRINGLTVVVHTHRQDDYGRALVRLYLNGEDISSWLVKQGWAWSYGARGSKGPYRLDELSARVARRGLFSDDNAIKPSAFRRQYKPCQFNQTPQLRSRHKGGVADSRKPQ